MKEVAPRKSSFYSSFLFRLARGLGKLIQRVPYSDEELLVSLGNSLKLHDQESRSLWGRFTSVFAGRTDPDDIEIDGMRLHQLFVLAGSKPPAEIVVSKMYALEVTKVQALLKAATENLKKRAPGVGS